jgi:leucine-zipper of insertion element IS481
MAHRNARLPESGRLLLVQRITELGWPAAPAAESLGGVAGDGLQVACPLPRRGPGVAVLLSRSRHPAPTGRLSPARDRSHRSAHALSTS